MVVQEVVQTVTGQSLVHQETGVVYRLELGEEISQWWDTKTVSQVTGTVTVLVMLTTIAQQVLRSWYQVQKTSWISVGYVAVVGLLHMQLVVRVR